MLIPLLITILFTVGFLFVLALCKSAAIGDEMFNHSLQWTPREFWIVNYNGNQVAWNSREMAEARSNPEQEIIHAVETL